MERFGTFCWRLISYAIIYNYMIESQLWMYAIGGKVEDVPLARTQRGLDRCDGSADVDHRWLGGISAFLLVPSATVTFNSGLPLTLDGFAVAAFANMTYPGRALAGGIALALGEGFVGSYLSPTLETPLVFGVLLVAGVVYLARSERFAGARRA